MEYEVPARERPLKYLQQQWGPHLVIYRHCQISHGEHPFNKREATDRIMEYEVPARERPLKYLQQQEDLI